MAKTKAKHGKKPHRAKFRNAARAARPTSSSATPANTIGKDHPKLTSGQSALYTAGGAAAAAALCAVIARYNWLPATFATGLATAIGGTTAAVATNPKFQAAGQGVMAAAGAQLGLVLIDNHYQEKATLAALASTKPDAKKPANAEGLPPGALEAAYERARRRLAMAEAAGQMAA